MKLFANIVKILTALAAVAGAIYVIATYGDKIVAWAKQMLTSFPCPECEEEAETVEEVTEETTEEAAEEVAVEEPVAEEPAAEVVVEETEPVAEEADFAE